MVIEPRYEPGVGALQCAWMNRGRHQFRLYEAPLMIVTRYLQRVVSSQQSGRTLVVPLSWRAPDCHADKYEVMPRSVACHNLISHFRNRMRSYLSWAPTERAFSSRLYYALNHQWYRGYELEPQPQIVPSQMTFCFRAIDALVFVAAGKALEPALNALWIGARGLPPNREPAPLPTAEELVDRLDAIPEQASVA